MIYEILLGCAGLAILVEFMLITLTCYRVQQLEEKIDRLTSALHDHYSKLKKEK